MRATVLADEPRNVDVVLVVISPATHGEASGHQRLARHARGGVVGENGVENRVRDRVRDLVRVTLGHGFRSEQVAIVH